MKQFPSSRRRACNLSADVKARQSPVCGIFITLTEDFPFLSIFFFTANTFLLLHKCWTLVMKYFYLKGQFRKSVANFQSYEHHK